MSTDEIVRYIREIELPGYGEDEVRFMAETVARAKPSHIFEWGTNRGSSACIFYQSARILDLSCDIHTVELPPEEAHRDRDHPGADSGLFVRDLPVHGHLGDGLEVSLRLYEELRPERSLFYLDGDHSYAAVLTELRTLSTAAPKAVLLMHDTLHLPSVATALAHFRPERHYDLANLASQAGMTALWPKLA